MEKADFVENFRKRTKQFALDGIYLFRDLPNTEEARIIGKQFLRSATSIAANYRAACRARSKAEFHSKLSITIEEADESIFWLELIWEANILPKSKIENLLKEASEITAVLTKARKTVQS
ncbi:MAG: four helix bundle protein [Sphingobacteriales bacterium]|nr:MAG: four helix bundle protein [Sphingobacteriales bacterium]